MNHMLLDFAAKGLKLNLTDSQFNSFNLLLAELARWNRKINLTAIKDDDEITGKHLIDSLYLAPELQAAQHMLDVGSGAGFPALVIAIARPDCLITSIDAVGKKISFQKHVSRILKLDNFEALHGRVEELAKNRQNCFELVVSRAFSSLALFFSTCGMLVCNGGKLISMRGPDAEHELQDLQEKIKSAGFISETAIKYQLPNNIGKRTLVRLRKEL